MATKANKNFSIGNVLIAAGIGFGGSILLDKLDEKVEWLGNNPWATGTAAALVGAGIEYFTDGKYPQITYPLIAIGAAKAGQSVMDSMNGLSYVNPSQGDQNAQMQGLLEDIKKYRAIEQSLYNNNNMPPSNSKIVEHSENPAYNYMPFKQAC